ncbi:unnamed protein product [Cyclocybe aegerita]|uniref:Uncharacterized protein n=1 Tax=Cyclocybe aegerita TaxID=1973307 RepID=A0A8S0XL34_CYCAE|nr:unnamed protein product [Cyclocybe aegerita]
MFGKGCHYCLRNLSKTIHKVEYARVKCCTRCLDEHFMVVASPQTIPGDYDCLLKERLPVIEVGSGKKERTYAFRSLHEKWSETHNTFQSHEEKLEWVAKEHRARIEIEHHARECEQWLERYTTRKETEHREIVRKRKAVFMARLEKSKWGPELKINDCKPDEHWSVVHASNNCVLDVVLKKLDKEFDQFMVSAKKTRLFEEKKKVIKKRMPILKRSYDIWVSTLPANAVCPPLSEVFRTPFVQEMFYSTPATAGETDDFLPSISASADAVIQQWLEKGIADLIKIPEEKIIPFSLIKDISSTTQSEAFPVAALELATTSFVCNNSECGPLQYPRVLMHTCPASSKPSQFDDRDEKVVFELTGQTYWNTGRSIRIVRDSKTIVEIVKLCGYDPRTTTAKEMDEANPILICIKCNDKSGRATMTWRTVVSCACPSTTRPLTPRQRASRSLIASFTGKYLPPNLSATKMVLKVLDEADTQKAQLMIAEAQERKLWEAKDGN